MCKCCVGCMRFTLGNVAEGFDLIDPILLSIQSLMNKVGPIAPQGSLYGDGDISGFESIFCMIWLSNNMGRTVTIDQGPNFY